MGIGFFLQVGSSKSNKRGNNGVDYALESIHNIKEALPELWEVDEKMNNRRLSAKIALETSSVLMA